nr:unnamed protein product [Naegleria fowleri]
MDELMHVRYEENTNLIRQIKILEQVVEERNQLHQIQASTNEKDMADKRMKELRWERKLQDIANEQKRELEILTEELDRLKKRSFPSFAVVERRKM